MTEKLKTWFTSLKAKFTAKIKTRKRGEAKDSMRIVCLYGIGLAVITFCLIWAWLYQWLRTGTPDIPILISFFREYTAPSVVAAVTFLSVFHVDKNRDGRPDIAEVKAKGETK